MPRFEFEFCNLALNLKTYFIWQNFIENIASPLLVRAKFAFPVSDANEDFDAPPPLAQSAYYCDIFLGARTTNKQKIEPLASQGQNLMDWSVELAACAFENNRTTVDPQSTGPDPNYDWRAFVLPRSAANRRTIKHALCRKQSG